MKELRGSEPEQFIKIKLHGRRTEQVTATHYFRNAHQRVVYCYCQLIGVNAVAAADDEVAVFLGEVEALLSVVAVGKGYFPVLYFQPVGGTSDSRFFSPLLRSKAAAGARIDYPAVAQMGSLGGMQFVSAAEAGIDKIPAAENIKIPAVDFKTAALKKAVACACVSTFVPCKPQPFQVAGQRVCVAARAAHAVQVFDAQQYGAAAAFGMEPGQQAAEYVAQMHKTAGSRGEAAEWFIFRHDVARPLQWIIVYILAHCGLCRQCREGFTLSKAKFIILLIIKRLLNNEVKQMSEERITDGYQDNIDIEKEAENICRWAAARAGVIVVAPFVGTMALMANEVYMITRLGRLRGVELEEGAVMGLLASLGATFVGQTLVTLIPFAPLQIPVGISVTYAVGKVADAWIKAGRPEDIASFKEVFDEARSEGMRQFKTIRDMDCREQPLGDESRRFDLDADKVFSKVTDTADKAEYKAGDLLRGIKDKLK